MAELDIAVAATIGTRNEQQDAASAVHLAPDDDTTDGATLLMLADGLGGHRDGAVAARMVIDTFDAAAKDGRFSVATGRRPALAAVILDINERMAAAVNPSDGDRGMGSTAVAAIIAGGTVRWISVGDSHLYVCRGGRLTKLNADHSQAAAMIRDGYSPDDKAVRNARSILVSALTGGEIEEIDCPSHDVTLEPGDVVVLASDGLNTLTDTEIAFVIDQSAAFRAEAIAAALIKTVERKDLRRQDNATVVVARVIEISAEVAKSDPTATFATLPLTYTQSSSGPIGRERKRGSLEFLAVLLTAALAASVIVTQTSCCGWP